MKQDSDTPADDSREPKTSEPIELDEDIKDILRKSFEARNYAVEFHSDYVVVTKNGQPKRITNTVVMQYINAFRK